MAPRKYIEISPGADFCIFTALALLLLPLNWILAAMTAAVFHECCHYLALRLLGVRVYGINLGSGGAAMETEPMTNLQELLCALAGPAGSMFLLCLIRYIPEIGICAGIQGLYNLLPLYPMDGGRAVNSLLGLLCPEKQARIFRWIQRGTRLAAALAALALVRYFGFGALAAAAILLRNALPRKIPCKAEPKRVQ